MDDKNEEFEILYSILEDDGTTSLICKYKNTDRYLKLTNIVPLSIKSDDVKPIENCKFKIQF